MDYKDFESGLDENNFWFLRKTEFIGIILKKLNLNKNIKILNIGAGTGNDISEMRNYGNVFVLDVDEKALNLIPDDLVEEKILADACNIPYPNNSFDLVVAFDVLEHIKDDAKVVFEVNRVLRPDGYFVFTVPAYGFLFSSHDKYLDHYRRYNKKKILSLLHQFKKIELGNWFFALFIPVAIQRLITKNKKYKPVTFTKIMDFIGNNILTLENYLFKKGVRYPWGLSFYGIFKKNK